MDVAVIDDLTVLNIKPHIHSALLPLGHAITTERLNTVQ